MNILNIKKFAATSALAIAALAIATGTASATPSSIATSPQSTQAPHAERSINYQVARAGASALLTTDAGSLTTTGNQLQIRDRSGEVVENVPLTYRFHDHAFPIAARVQGNTATLTPSTNLAQSTPVKDVALPFLHKADLDAAMGAALVDLTVASVAAGIIGAIVGGVGGCIGGAVLGLGVTAPLAGLLGAGPLAGCALGAITLAPVGAVAGAIVIGGPALIATAFQFVQLLGQPAK